MLEASDSDVLSAIAKKREQIKEAKKASGAAGRRVAVLNEELELMLVEGDKREERRRDRIEAERYMELATSS